MYLPLPFVRFYVSLHLCVFASLRLPLHRRAPTYYGYNLLPFFACVPFIVILHRTQWDVGSFAVDLPVLSC